MKVEIFSDVICPWCAIGKRRFESALERFAYKNEVDVQWRAFELDPSTPANSEVDTASYLASKYGMTRDQAVASQERLTETALVEGLEFHIAKTKRANTFDAHRLLHFAREVGCQDALEDRLFRAYFTEGERIDDRETLARLGEQVGLDAPQCLAVLNSDRYAVEVRSDEHEAQELRIGGVPFFLIDRHFGIAGAQSPDAILEVLDEAWAKEHRHFAAPHPSDSACESDSCVL